jgi:L-fuconolactonase
MHLSGKMMRPRSTFVTNNDAGIPPADSGVDAHQHFWHFTAEDYAWIAPDQAVLRRDFLPEDLAVELDRSGLRRSVAVQVRQNMEETNWLLELADRYPRIAAVIGWIDLRNPRVEQDLERLRGRTRLRGLRHLIQDEPDPLYMLQPDFVRGIGLLSRYGLTYDLLVYSRHLETAVDFVRMFPDLPIVLDHLGKPRIRDGEFDSWRKAIRLLASHENLCCKVSGMVTEAAPGRWKPGDFRPYIEAAIEAFGLERVMFGSDWPVCLLEAKYHEVRDIAGSVVDGFSTSEREAFFG